jgi:hypothetical protein
MNSLITKSFPNEPVTMSAIANPVIITNAKNPTTDFSLIALLSLNNIDKNFFIIFGNLLTNKYHKKGRPSSPFVPPSGKCYEVIIGWGNHQSNP